MYIRFALFSQDCPNGLDEYKCDKYLGQFSLKPRCRLARQEMLKLVNVTVTACAKYCAESTNFRCKAFNYRYVNQSNIYTELFFLNIILKEFR